MQTEANILNDQIDEILKNHLHPEFWDGLDILTRLDLRLALCDAYKMGVDEMRYLAKQGVA